jgi:periplasmic divalent cation tolerance protein
MSDAAIVYSTFPDEEQANAAARTLLEERLLACANVLPGVTSHYRWEGAMQCDREVLLIGKTRQELVERAMNRLRAIHPYQTPAITSWPIAACDADYAAWIAASTIASPEHPSLD